MFVSKKSIKCKKCPHNRNNYFVNHVHKEIFFLEYAKQILQPNNNNNNNKTIPELNMSK